MYNIYIYIYTGVLYFGCWLEMNWSRSILVTIPDTDIRGSPRAGDGEEEEEKEEEEEEE